MNALDTALTKLAAASTALEYTSLPGLKDVETAKKEATPAADFGVGVHSACILVEFEQAKKSEAFKASVVYIATYRDTESAAEIDDIIKFDGSKRDHFSGLRVERLHAIIGAELPPDGHHPDFKNLLDLSDGLFFAVEMTETQKDGKTDLDIKDVRANKEAAI